MSNWKTHARLLSVDVYQESVHVFEILLHQQLTITKTAAISPNGYWLAGDIELIICKIVLRNDLSNAKWIMLLLHNDSVYVTLSGFLSEKKSLINLISIQIVIQEYKHALLYMDVI